MIRLMNSRRVMVFVIILTTIVTIFLGFYYWNAFDWSKPQKTIVLFFDDGWENQYRIAFPILRLYGFHATFGIITGTIGGGSPGTDWAYMTEDQIRDLGQNSIEVAGHSYSHLQLTQLPNELLTMELEKSKETLEDLLGKPVETFIIPFNVSNQTVEEAILQQYVRFRQVSQIIWVTNETVEKFGSLIYDGAFLIYHSIRIGNESWSTPPITFHSHMEYLHKSGYRAVSFEEFLAKK